LENTIGGIIFMHENEITMKIIAEVTDQFPEVDGNALRDIIESALYNYEIQPKTTALVVQSDMNEMIMLCAALASVLKLFPKECR
jgi:hypothetical protein